MFLEQRDNQEIQVSMERQVLLVRMASRDPWALQDCQALLETLVHLDDQDL